MTLHLTNATLFFIIETSCLTNAILCSTDATLYVTNAQIELKISILILYLLIVTIS